VSLYASSCPVLPFDRRGRLNNGNPAGDFLAAPRCGARTRAGCTCRQPAMRNGRCRLHGGLSTGARTASGRERCRRAPWKHGARSAEVAALRRQARLHLRRVRFLVGLANGRPAGHGVPRSHFKSGVGARPSGRPSRDTGGRPRGVAPIPRPAADVRPDSPGVSPPNPAGHGVLRSFFGLAPLVRRLRRLWT
jgi:glucans biosynthesis protein